MKKEICDARSKGECPFVISEKQTAPGIPEMLLDSKYPQLEGRFHPRCNAI